MLVYYFNWIISDSKTAQKSNRRTAGGVTGREKPSRPMATPPIITQHTHLHTVYSILYAATDHSARRFLKEPVLAPKITKGIFRFMLSNVLMFPTLLSSSLHDSWTITQKYNQLFFPDFLAASIKLSDLD